MNKQIIKVLMLVSTIFLPFFSAKAMPVGTLLYRTSGGNQMYGFNSSDLIVAENSKLAHIYSGHAAIYVGQENGIDYIVEMQPKGAIKVPAKYFINEAAGEKLVGAKLPEKATPLQIATAVAIAKNLALNNAAYDFDFKKQKGPGSGEWTCVGLTEKVYESSNISNPTNIKSLEYNPNYYAIDITPDGYDNFNVYNKSGDCFADSLEYSKISAKKNMLIPAPELVGYDVGLEVDDDRYIFLPYTQSIQPSLKDVSVDINLSSSFPESEIRGDSPLIGLILKWSLINNPISTVKNLARSFEKGFVAIKEKVFPDNSVALADYSSAPNNDVAANSKSKATTTTKSTKATTTKTSSTKIAATKVNVTKSSSVKTNVSLPIVASSTSKISTSSSISKMDSTDNKIVNIVPRTTIRPVTSVVNNPINNKKTTSTTNVIITPVNQDDEISQVVASSTNIVSSTPKTNNEEAIVEEDKEPPVALIAKIYSNESDDWLEIVNASNYDFDLAEAGYRLEKAKTGSDPTLIMRIGDENDGIYPGGTIIKASSTYLIANDEASPDILAKADAIAIKDTFSWTEDSYTIYLGTASISSDSDADIIDKLGYGEAKYFESSPAPSLKKGYALERKANVNSTLELLTKGGLEEFWPRLFDSNDNSEDFILVPYDESLIDLENNNLEDEVVINSDLYKEPVGLDSENLTQLWHFDECYGSTAFNELQISGKSPVDFIKSEQWAVGKWGCAASLGYGDTPTKATFSESLDTNQFTMNFYYRNKDESVGFAVGFFNSSPDEPNASLEFTPYYTGFSGFPGPSGRLNDVKWPNDNKWHQVSLVIDRKTGYLSLYLDSKEVYRYEYNGIIPLFKFVSIVGTTDNKTDFDELSFWNRSLPPSELKTINVLDQPFNPYSWPSKQQESQLLYHWNFDENSGSVTKDSLSQQEIIIDSSQWNMEGKFNSALTIGKNIAANFSERPITDLSLSFWWRNISSSNEGRLQLSLNGGGNSIMSLKPTPYNAGFGFNGYSNIFINYPGTYIPNDKNWHHFVLTYDSYRYLLKFYVDGEEKYVKEFVKLKNGSKIDSLSIIQENWPSAIDELKIWSGVLFPKQVKVEYEAVK
jgi:hypothetical protein